MPKPQSIEELLKNGSKIWNDLRRENKVPIDHTGATFTQLFSANADLSGIILIGSEWEKCDLSRVSFRDADLTNSYFHGGRLQDCDFRGAKLEGATFERLKLLRCDFTNAQGLDEVEFSDTDMDRVVGLGGEDAPPPAPPPAIGITSFTKEQRTAAIAAQHGPSSDLPPFRPGDTPGALLQRYLVHVSNPPLWVLDVPNLRLPVPVRMTSGTSLQNLYREAVKARLDGRRAVADNLMVQKAQEIVADAGEDSALALTYLDEVGVPLSAPEKTRTALAKAMTDALAEDDPTGDVDPRLVAAVGLLKMGDVASEHLGEFRMRLAACRLFVALLEAGFTPENNWEEAVESSEASVDLAHTATNGQRDRLPAMFRTFADLPEEVRMRRLAFLAEGTARLESAIP